MLVDYERVVRDLLAFLPTKPYHGSKDLALKVAELTAVASLDETLPEQVLRMYGVQFSEDLRVAARDTPSDDGGRSSAVVAAGEHAHRSQQTGRSTDDRTDEHPRSEREPGVRAA